MSAQRIETLHGTVTLVFSNADATPKTSVVRIAPEAVPQVVGWYAAYHAGDRFTVAMDGRNVPLDHNGEVRAVKAKG